MKADSKVATLAGAEAWTRHRGPVTSVAVIPGRRSVVTGAYDSAVGIYGLDDGAVHLLGHHNHLVNQVIVDSTGLWAASCSSDYTIRIWNLEEKRLARVLIGHSDDIEDFVFVNSEVGVSGSRDNRILIWDLRTGAILNALDEHLSYVVSVAYADGKIYSAGFDHTLRVWDLETGRLQKTWGPFQLRTDTCAIDPRRRRVALGCDDGIIRLFDVDTGAMSGEIRAHASAIKRVALSPTGGDVLSAAYDQKVIIWDRETLQRKVELDNAPGKWERSFAWSPDGLKIIAGSFDGTVLEWDAVTGRFLQEVGLDGSPRGNACFNRIATSPNDRVALVSDDGYVRLASMNPSSALWTDQLAPLSGRVLMNAVALDDPGGMVAAGSHDQNLHLFRRVSGGYSASIEISLGEGPINSIVFRPMNSGSCRILVGCYSGAVVQLTPEGEVLRRIRINKGAVKAVRAHPREEIGVSCCADGLIVSWSFDGRAIQRYIGHTAIINDLDLDGSGTRLCSVSRDFTLKVWDFQSGRLLETYVLGHRSLKCACYYSERFVIVGDYWGTLIRTDLISGEITRRKIANNGVSSLARMGEHVVACSYDGGVYLVDPRDDLRVLQTIRAMTQNPHHDR